MAKENKPYYDMITEWTSRQMSVDSQPIAPEIKEWHLDFEAMETIPLRYARILTMLMLIQLESDMLQVELATYCDDSELC